MKADNKGSSPTGKPVTHNHVNEATDDEVLTVPEAAAILRVNKKTVYDAVGRGEIPHQHIGRKIRLCRYALVAWLSQGQGRVPRSPKGKNK